ARVALPPRIIWHAHGRPLSCTSYPGAASSSAGLLTLGAGSTGLSSLPDMKRALLALGVATLIAGLAAPAAAAKPGRATLTGFASLPAATFVPDSEASGTALGTDPINGLTPPFAG